MAPTPAPKQAGILHLLQNPQAQVGVRSPRVVTSSLPAGPQRMNPGEESGLGEQNILGLCFK